MRNTYKMDNVFDALNLAIEFQQTGKYNLFRGQSQNWKVKSTFGRLTNTEVPKYKEIFERLIYFYETNQQLDKYVSDKDWFWAVAQHYGLPTKYIDFSFSPNIAAFFATNSDYTQIGKDCVIICLNETEFTKFVERTKSTLENEDAAPPSIIKPNVDNLWRLQAQKGCFLFSPYADFESYYDFDRIIFPYSEPYKDVLKEKIYPEIKSELEILLDHFFDVETRIKRKKRFDSIIKEFQMPQTTLGPLDYNKYLKIKSNHFSWDKEITNKWEFLIKEEWDDLKVIENIEININSEFNVEKQINFTIGELSNQFQLKHIRRNSICTFKISEKSHLPIKLSTVINKSCSRIWDGMRNLPYTDNEIYTVMAKYICLEINSIVYDKILSFNDEEVIVIELTNQYGSISTSFVSRSKVVSSYRSDIKEILHDNHGNIISSELLLLINNPKIIFDFNKLLNLFKEEIIAYQVLNNSKNNNPVIFYTPTQISVLGYK